METKTGTRPEARVGRPATVATIAGLAGVAVTLAVASSMLMGAVFGAGGSGLAPGYADYGQRQRAGAAAAGDGTAGGRDDYAIRCLEAGWCSVPPGVAQPTK